MILAPLVRGRRGQHGEIFQQVRKAGFVRVRVNQEIYDLDHLPELNAKQNHHIDAVVDRVIVRPGIESRLAESINLAVKHGDGLVAVLYYDEHSPANGNGHGNGHSSGNGPSKSTKSNGNGNGHANGSAQPSGTWRDVLYSTRYACPDCKISFEELEPRTFSFNSPYGACPECEGLGVRNEFDPDLILPDKTLSLATGAIAPWKSAKPSEEKKQRIALDQFLINNKLAWETQLHEYKPKQLEKLLLGDEKKFLGLLTMLEQELATATSENRQEQLNHFRGAVTCRACGGSRLRKEANSVRLGGKAIHEITRLTIGEARGFFAGLQFDDSLAPIGEPLVEEIGKRLTFLDKVGVTYLTLDRAADTLSGGELQRVRLATSIGSGLVGVCYVLDEPSIGLHPRDNQRLIEAMRDLQTQGNTVIVVEHDEAIMRQSDWLIDIGPGAGQHGGQVMSQGTPAEVQLDPRSLTGKYLSGALKIEVPAKRRRACKTRSITIEGVTTNNLKNVTAHFPLGVLCCVTGVSGSGKSSLINETLARALVRRLGGSAPKPGPHTSLRGASQIDKIIEIDQQPIGRSPRSNCPATYSGIFAPMRELFAAIPEARARGYESSRFSFNVKGGRCEVCQGTGVMRIAMHFLPDAEVTCESCEGRRYSRETLDIRYRGLSIADALALTVDEADDAFGAVPDVHGPVARMREVGLGYVRLGQSATTLSGGEAQRIKLAAELASTAKRATRSTSFDEPTTRLALRRHAASCSTCCSASSTRQHGDRDRTGRRSSSQISACGVRHRERRGHCRVSLYLAHRAALVELVERELPVVRLPPTARRQVARATERFAHRPARRRRLSAELLRIGRGVGAGGRSGDRRLDVVRKRRRGRPRGPTARTSEAGGSRHARHHGQPRLRPRLAERKRGRQSRASPVAARHSPLAERFRHGRRFAIRRPGRLLESALLRTSGRGTPRRRTDRSDGRALPQPRRLRSLLLGRFSRLGARRPYARRAMQTAVPAAAVASREEPPLHVRRVRARRRAAISTSIAASAISNGFASTCARKSRPSRSARRRRSTCNAASSPRPLRERVAPPCVANTRRDG